MTKPPPAAIAPPTAVPESLDDVDARAERLVEQMTIEEKLDYIGGERGFFIRAVPRLGIPEIKFADGPLGCRNWGPSTAYPATIGIAASFDDELAAKVGGAIARDCRARGVHVLLAPAVNIQRSPLNGRNFEYMGEDPYLAAQIATQMVNAVQSEGVVATVKHFAANNQEWNRNNISSEVDQRTLREIYLPAFERVVREGHVGAVMSAYNPLNGIYSSHHPWLLTKVLREEWGFRGLVMSDWMAIHDPIGGALGGCDLEMPRAVQMSSRNLQTLLDTGVIAMADIDSKVRRILRTMLAAGFFERDQTLSDVALDCSQSSAVALDAARESLVLLKNDNEILPLDSSSIRKVAVIGPNAHPAVHGGAGSSYVTPFDAVSVLDGLRAVVPDVTFVYHSGVQHRTRYSSMGAPCFVGKVRQEIFQGKALEGVPVDVREVDRIDFDPADGVSPVSGVGVEMYSIRWSGEVDVPATGKFHVMTNADDGIRVFLDGRKVLDDFTDHAPRTVEETVTLDAGRHSVVVEYFQGVLGAIAQFGFGPALDEEKSFGAMEIEQLVRDVDAVILCLGYGQNASTNSISRSFDAFWPPGWAREANVVEAEDSDRLYALPEAQLATLRLVAESSRPTVVVLNAGGGVDFDGWLQKVQGLLWAWYPGQEGGTAIAEVLFGTTNPSGKLPITMASRYEDYPSAAYYHLDEGGQTPYSEGLLVGYRGFDASGTEPAFPFGFGLSYTSFAYSSPSIALGADGEVELKFSVKNTGARAGAEVAQIYIAPPRGNGRPPQKLEGYARVQLAPGAQKLVRIALPPRAFAYWSDGWIVDAGRYEIHIGASSRERQLSLGVEMPARRLEH